MDREASTSHDLLERMLLDESVEPTQLPLSLLENITNHFSIDHQIGIGGFAVVYKGKVGKGMVAVKRLTNTFRLHENKFQWEVECLIKAKHKNIVRFLGYCAETQGKMENYEGKLIMTDQRNWLLCFEYVHNGGLDKHITDASHGLEWRERYRIIKGICEGLLFLHEKRILHLDLKPANILLDHQMVPKIADFGLSRCLGEDHTRLVTKNLCGTLGYMDPEYLRSGQITFASDIFSLGVIIMEILTGVKGYLEAENVVQSWMNRLGAIEGDMQLEQVRVCTEIGIECMNLDPMKRPVAQHIIDMLHRTASANYSDETGINSSSVELQVSLPRDQLGERIGKLAVERLQKADVEEHSGILEDVAEPLEWLHFQEGQPKIGQLSLCDVQSTKQKVNHHGAKNSSSIPVEFYELKNMDIINRNAYKNFHSNDRRTLEKSHVINIFRKEELKPIIRSENLIGKGGFTEVYMGVVDDALVAVKKPIIESVLEKKQVENEVIIQSQFIHRNIVRFIGCCLEMDAPMLVYEFLPRGSLHDILHSGSKVPLKLDVRLGIIAESAQGLAYLHSQARTKILHGDFKTKSILFDDNFTPKVSGFGLSSLITRKKEYASRVIGSKAYMDPVYQETGLLTEKSDVYSFGVVILELISRKKATPSDNDSLVKDFLEFQKKGKKATELFDKEIVKTRDLEILDCLAVIAVECLNLDVDLRPSMTDVAERLLILHRSRRLHAQDTSVDFSEETGIRSSFVQQQKVGTSFSQSISTALNWKGRKNFDRNRHTLEKSHFIRIFKKNELMPMLRSSNLIGQGRFTEVYKGVIDYALVAVKIGIRWNKPIETEVIIHSQVIHKNIVRLLGCCLEMGAISMLVYEFMPRGSLDDILHSDSEVPLSLDVRLTIAAESAQGLAYLHSQAHGKILHGDVRPKSILIDDYFMPKISGFGLSRLVGRDKQHTDNIIGSMTYVDPTYRTTGLVTEKSDVYGFGIVILELITREKSTYSYDSSLVRSFVEVHEKGEKATDLFDKEIAAARNLDILDRLAEIAVECLDLDVDERPSMTDVAERLLILQRYHRSQVARLLM